VQWVFSGDEQVTQGWNTVFSQEDRKVTAVNVDYNGTLRKGSSVSMGVVVAGGDDTGVPVDILLNGHSCSR
jgi:hypothetical protein